MLQWHQWMEGWSNSGTSQRRLLWAVGVALSGSAMINALWIGCRRYLQRYQPPGRRIPLVLPTETETVKGKEKEKKEIVKGKEKETIQLYYYYNPAVAGLRPAMNLTVIFESGMAMNGAAWFHLQRRLAQEGIPSLSYDRPGYGRSTARHRRWNMTEGFLSQTLMIRAASPFSSSSASDRVGPIDRLCEQLHLPGPFILCGHGWGALYSMAYALHRPEKVAALLLLDPVSASLLEQAQRSWLLSADLHWRWLCSLLGLTRFWTLLARWSLVDTATPTTMTTTLDVEDPSLRSHYKLLPPVDLTAEDVDPLLEVDLDRMDEALCSPGTWSATLEEIQHGQDFQTLPLMAVESENGRRPAVTVVSSGWMEGSLYGLTPRQLAPCWLREQATVVAAWHAQWFVDEGSVYAQLPWSDVVFQTLRSICQSVV